MSRACYQVSWGLLLILIDIRIEWFDVFPDIIGYLLLLAGLSDLKQENRYFDYGYKAGWLVMILSVIVFLMTFGQQPVGIEQIGNISPIRYLLDILLLIGNMLLVYGICKGIEVRAEGLRQTVLKQSARTRLHFFLAIQLMSLFVMPFGMNVSQDITVAIVFVLGIAAIICWISIVLLARAAGRWWREEQAADI